MKLSNISDVLTALKLTIWLISIIFLVVYIIIIKNSIFDLKKNIKITRYVGYNKIQVKSRIILLLLLLFILTFVVSLFLNIIFSFLVNYLFSFKLNLLNLLNLMIVFIIGILINITCGITIKS